MNCSNNRNLEIVPNFSVEIGVSVRESDLTVLLSIPSMLIFPVAFSIMLWTKAALRTGDLKLMQFQYSASRCEITGGALHIVGISYLAPRMALWHLKTRPPTITSTSASSPVCSSSNMPCGWERVIISRCFHL